MDYYGIYIDNIIVYYILYSTGRWGYLYILHRWITMNIYIDNIIVYYTLYSTGRWGYSYSLYGWITMEYIIYIYIYITQYIIFCYAITKQLLKVKF